MLVRYAISVWKSLQEIARDCVQTGCLTVLKPTDPAEKMSNKDLFMTLNWDQRIYVALPLYSGNPKNSG